MENYCKKCKNKKNIKDFYKCNSSICKDCKKSMAKMYREQNKYQEKYLLDINSNMEILASKINYIELMLKEMYSILITSDSKIKNTEFKKISKYDIDNNLNGIEDTINNIKYSNEKTNRNIDTIIDYNKNNIKIYEDYERTKKEILND